MDPNLFHIDWDRTFEVLIAIIILAFLTERALALIFEHRIFIKKYDKKGIKEPIAFGLAFLVCWQWQFDAVSMVILSEKTTVLGEAITAGVIAGGSKASIKLFHDVMDVRSKARKERDQADGRAGSNGPTSGGTAPDPTKTPSG